jgi:hypothetical protein
VELWYPQAVAVEAGGDLLIVDDIWVRGNRLSGNPLGA